MKTWSLIAQPGASMCCGICRARLGEHHEKTCKHWGQVLPSECPDLLEEIAAEIARRKP